MQFPFVVVVVWLVFDFYQIAVVRQLTGFTNGPTEYLHELPLVLHTILIPLGQIPSTLYYSNFNKYTKYG